MCDPGSYFAALHARRKNAEFMQRRKVQWQDWSPEPAKCHDNVDFWISHNPHLKATRGWMISCGSADGHCMYEAHSVIEDEGGLYDITICEDVPCESIPFVRHIGTDEEFAIMRTNRAQVIYPAYTNEELSGLSAQIEEPPEAY